MATYTTPQELQLCKTRIWWKDPSMLEDQGFGIRDEIIAGVRSSDFWPFTHYVRLGADAEITDESGNTTVKINSPCFSPDSNGDLLFKQNIRGTWKFDATNVLTVVTQVFTMWNRTVQCLYDVYTAKDINYQNAFGPRLELTWHWGMKPITAYPFGMIDANAYYSRNEQALKFGIIEKDDEEYIFTCHSTDIIAHETGHAILDGLKPLFSDDSSTEAGALHESFGDLSAIFFALSRFDMLQKAIVQTKGDLSSIDNFLPKLAPQFGEFKVYKWHSQWPEKCFK